MAVVKDELKPPLDQEGQDDNLERCIENPEDVSAKLGWHSESPNLVIRETTVV